MIRNVAMIVTAGLAACSSSGGSGLIDDRTNEAWNLCNPALRSPAWNQGVTMCSSDNDCGTSEPGDFCRGFCVTGMPPGSTGFCFTGGSLGVRARGAGCKLAGDCEDDALSCCTKGNLLDPADESLFTTKIVSMCAPPGVYSLGGTCGIDPECACAFY